MARGTIKPLQVAFVPFISGLQVGVASSSLLEPVGTTCSAIRDVSWKLVPPMSCAPRSQLQLQEDPLNTMKGMRLFAA